MPHSPINSNLVDMQNRFSLAVNRDTMLFTSNNREKYETGFKSVINQRITQRIKPSLMNEEMMVSIRQKSRSPINS